MSRLRVLAGPSPSSLVPISNLVNTNVPHPISTDLFEGHVVVNIKGFTDPNGQTHDSEYFHRLDREGITWSIQVQGRVMEPCSGNDILFGNTFDSPLNLPWGSNAVLKLMTFKDPSLEHDLTSQTKPWALSPLISTMPHFSLSRSSGSSSHIRWGTNESDQDEEHTGPNADHAQVPPFPPEHSIKDDLTQIHIIDSDDDTSFESNLSPSSPSSSSSSLSRVPNTGIKSRLKKKLDNTSLHHKNDPVRDFPQGDQPVDGVRNLQSTKQRRKYFRNPEHRKGVIFGPQDILTMDFCHGYLEFHPRITLRLPGGISFDAMKHWDGRPVRFICCKRKNNPEGGASAPGTSSNVEDPPYGSILWCVQFELVELEDNEGTKDECDGSEQVHEGVDDN